MNSDNVHVRRFGEVDGIVCVFDGFEAGEGERGFGDSSPDDGAGKDLVERL